MSNTCVSENVTDFTSNEIRGFQNAVKTLMEVDGKFNIADIFPWLKPLDPQRIRSKAKAAYSWLDAVSDDFIRQRLKHRQSKLRRYGDFLDSLLDFSQENEAEFNCKHIKILLVIVSNGEYNSVQHRVLANANKEPRISIVEFFNFGIGDGSKLYGPIPELLSLEKPALYRTFTKQEFDQNFFSKGLDSKSLVEKLRIEG
ncbi:hypothetical protein RJ640_000023 [Escallonia rubra]|uniref:Isopenicillin N synthase-like Fe(2+) 2OG dioxygenase domain-containing protein n=1 Tax=Escallonia rubra TaxID=112253 RepID=A0AA88U6H8_9ASTE|nr:hypothetical protein RJ640_000023 [Escallonia rubra]